MTATGTAEPVKKVGVLLVHGIGEQCQFEHLEGEVRNIVTALQLSEGKTKTIQVVVNSFPFAAFGANQETWQAGGQAPVMVEVYDNGKITQIYFHQVWWADLDEPTTLWSEIRFWLWGLSLWTIKRCEPYLPGSARMRWPNNVQVGQSSVDLIVRLRLFWVSLVILLILPVLSLSNFVLRRLLAIKIPRPDILSQFIGDVKLFQQDKRVGKGPLLDLGLPPRVTLRRRMIRGLVEMALCPYDRWYILAHSQGTVLAFNGIMETAQSLPNYLTKELWEEAKAKSLIRRAETENERLKPQEKETMRPPFPSWRDKEYILDRRELFKNLRGLLTYGSPLSKFAALWPVIVPLNQDDSCVFPKEFQWLNVYDPTDPVAGETRSFKAQEENGTCKAPEPIDIPYKANRFHLLSHVEYLTFSKGNHPRLVDVVANWLVEGDVTVNKNDLTISTNTLSVERGYPRWPTLNLIRFYQVLGVATWVIVAFLLGSLLSVMISAIPQISSYSQLVTRFTLSLISPWLQLGVMPLWLKLVFTVFFESLPYLLLAVMIVAITGILIKLFFKDLGKL